jgi:hypothetical protein
VQGSTSGAAAQSTQVDLNAFFTSQDKSNDEGAVFLQQYLQQRLWAQDGDDAGVPIAASVVDHCNASARSSNGCPKLTTLLACSKQGVPEVIAQASRIV